MKKEYLECGRVLGAHGIRGVLKVESWCDSPRVLAGQKRVFLAEEGGYREYKVLTASANGPCVLMSVEGIDSRESAIAMKNKVFYLHRSDIPVKDGAMLIADMIGLDVVDAVSGRRYGEISDVIEVPRGLLYTIKTEGKDVLFPHVDEFIKEIDAERGMLITPIPGFFDDLE